LPSRVEIHMVLVTRQALAVALQRDSPRSRLAQPLLQVRSQSRLRRAARPALPTRPRLDAVAAQEPDVRLPLHTEIPEARDVRPGRPPAVDVLDRKSTRLNSSHVSISYAVFCLKKKKPDSTL